MLTPSDEEIEGSFKLRPVDSVQIFSYTFLQLLKKQLCYFLGRCSIMQGWLLGYFTDLRGTAGKPALRQKPSRTLKEVRLLAQDQIANKLNPDVGLKQGANRTLK